MRGVVAIVMLAGCGRVGFGEEAALGSADASADSSAPMADAHPSFCATVTPAPLLCDDFDSGAPFGSTWTRTVMNQGATVAPSMMFSQSAPISAQHAVPDADVSSNNIVSTLELDVANASSVSFAMDLLLPTRPTGDETVELPDIALTVPGVGTFFNDIELDQEGSLVDSYHEEFFPADMSPFMQRDHTFGPITTGGWHHLAITIDFAAQTFTCALDGAIVASGATTYATSPGAVTFQSGINYAQGPLQAWTMYVDNVVIDAQ